MLNGGVDSRCDGHDEERCREKEGRILGDIFYHYKDDRLHWEQRLLDVEGHVPWYKVIR